MSKKRQIKRQEEVKEKILSIAQDIIKREGIKSLSIRKITNIMDYSPAIIYHYFKDKNEILETLFKRGYLRILNTITNVKTYEDEPEKEIKEAFINYIKAVLTFPEEYMAYMFNDDKSIIEKTEILKPGVSNKRHTFKILYDNIKRGIDIGRYAHGDIELTAQILWTSTFGLVTRIILEKNLTDKQIERLIERHFEILFNGILKR